MLYKPLIKRLIDFIASGLGVLSLLPLFFIVAIAIKLQSPGPVFYRQTRVGKHTRHFRIWKFRSMVQNADQVGAYSTQGSADPRITKIGAFLRKTSLDELPQLINVLLGDMSLIGPRPDTPMQEKDYSADDWQLRHKVKPGITGLAQISGRSQLGAQERLRHDLHYAKRITFLTDFNILWRTALLVLRRKGTN